MEKPTVQMNKSTAAALIALVTLHPTVGAEPIKTPTGSALSKCIVKEAEKSGFSGVIAIAQPGGTISHAQGYMAGSGSAAIAPDAQFNLGSAGKMFTAVAVAQLIDAKKVALIDPIGRYISGLTPEASAVTVRQLLTHSGGLGNFFSPDNLPVLQKAKSLSDLKPLVVGDKPAFTPGSRFEYSNSSFLLLGLMIERVAAQSYGDYLKRHVFKPSGMTGSGLVPGARSKRAIGMTTMPEMPPPGADGMPGPIGPYQGGPPPGPPPGPPGALSGLMLPPPGPLRPAAEAALMGNSAGGGYSNAPDMQRFFAAFLAGKLTSTAMRDMLMSPQIVAIPAKGDMPTRSHGLGFGVGSYKGHRWTGHNGGTLGVNVETMTFPDDQSTVIIMANRDPPVATALMRKVQSMLFDGASCNQVPSV
jgi:D-alanyl-D-alanine carboxypeptidase